MSPAAAAWRLGCSLLLGGCLGLFYGFLRPLGKRHRHFADTLFALAAVWVWLSISFGICRGDIRTVYLLGMIGGILLWESTFGPYLRPVFTGIWGVFAGLFRIFLFPWKKFLEITKILFASAEKWVTIKRTKICKSHQKRRKESHGRKIHPAENCESGSSSCIQYP